MTQPILEIKNLTKRFPIHSGLLLRETGAVHALENVSLSIPEGKTLGLVGESGCGKSTLGRTVIRIYDPTSGQIIFQGKDVTKFNSKELMNFRRHVQMIFQDPYSSLNPRMTIHNIVSQPLVVHKIGDTPTQKKMVQEILERVGLGAWALNRYPHEFSGGQRQRIAIARAIILKPKLIIADEPVSALDVSVQSQILNLMKDLQSEFKITYLFIAHDLAVVRHMAQEVSVMYLGRIAEKTTSEELFKNPRHPYTQALKVANPEVGRGKIRKHILLQGDVPSPVNPPSGCRFHPRCSFAVAKCKTEIPELKNIGDGNQSIEVACHLVKSKDDFPKMKLNS